MSAGLTICLNMIVKNEAHIIAETLRNICANIPITYWVISDTGSTDGTQAVITETFAALGIPGELHERPWVNFGHNRNEALQLCKGKADFVLFFDADDLITGKPDFSDLRADAYDVTMQSDNGHNIRYSRKLFLRNDGRARWRGVVHEYVDTADMKVAPLRGDYAVISRRLGARSQDPEKYRKDALLLEAGFDDPNDADIRPRYAFYCANSWKDYGDRDKALDWYEKRVALKGWIEERYLSCMEAGLICERKGNMMLAVDWMLRGHELVPERAECLYYAARMLRVQGRFRTALALARAALEIPRPGGTRLFLNAAIYDFWVPHEFLWLTGRTGGNPQSFACYEPFMASAAPADIKQSVRDFVPKPA